MKNGIRFGIIGAGRMAGYTVLDLMKGHPVAKPVAWYEPGPARVGVTRHATNPKSQARNPKQIPKIQTLSLPAFLASGLNLSPFRLPFEAGLFEHTDRDFGPLPDEITRQSVAYPLSTYRRKETFKFPLARLSRLFTAMVEQSRISAISS